jgi:hypothetical protein
MQPKPIEKIEFRIVDTSELPPIVITQGEDDAPKVVINTYHKLWISINRRTIAGIIEALQSQMDTVLQGYLKEQYQFQTEDRDFMGE